MRSPAAQLLETAVALQRAPGERFRLRERPLPPNLLPLIEIAAASPAALQAVAAELDEPEASLRDAARFYLEQVLFADPDADAYRVLGVAPGAANEAIRAHHRWLQRWLHPDRAQAGDASVFSTRVNQAFAQLRSPEARHAYDVRLAEARLAGASAPLRAETLRHWEHAEEAPRSGGRSRWLLAAGLAACAVLAVLMVREQEPPATWPSDDGPQVASTEDDTAAAGAAPEASSGFARLGAALADTPGSAASAARTSMPTSATDAATPPERAIAIPTSAAAGSVSVAAAAPAPARKTALPPAPVPAPVRATTLAAQPVPIPPPAPAPAVSKAPPRPPSPPVASSAAPAPAPPVTVAASPEASAPATPPPPASPAISEADAQLVMVRLPLAAKRIDEVAGYLAVTPGAVPLWDTVGAMDQADAVRERLDVRKGSPLQLGTPSWRVRPDQASADSPYRCRSNGGSPCAGRLRVNLVWREGLWLVSAVALEPSA